MTRIDADNLKARLRDTYKRRESDPRVCGIIDDVKGIVDSLIDVIDEEPIVDSVNHGHWITNKYWLNYECSECGDIEPTASNYCPWCGAKMDD